MTDDNMPEPVAWMHDGFVSTNKERVLHDEMRNRSSGFKAKPVFSLYTADQLRAALAAQAQEIERLREVVTACHQALFQAQEAAKVLMAKGEMLAAVVQGAKEEFVRVPYGASHEDVAAINDWHKMAAEALSEWENKA